VREIHRLYVALPGAKSVARALNERGCRYRTGVPWSKDLVLNVLSEAADRGVHWWGRRRAGCPRPRREWIAIKVEPIVDVEVHKIVQRLRAGREPSRRSGRAPTKPLLLAGLLRCARCGASFQLETSGKTIDGNVYRYRYYNCWTFCRAGKEICIGRRIPIEALDAAVLAHVADAICRPDRVARLRALAGTDGPADLATAWRKLVTQNPGVARAYLEHLVERIDVHESSIIVVPRTQRTGVTEELGGPNGTVRERDSAFAVRAFAPKCQRKARGSKARAFLLLPHPHCSPVLRLGEPRV
jgi:hypothetical protein